MKTIKTLLNFFRRKRGLSTFVFSEVSKHLKPIDLAAEFICTQQIVGDYLEFGSYKGDSFIEAYHKIEASIKDWSSRNRAYRTYSDKKLAEEAFAKIKRLSLRYFSFDSFQGLPNPQGIDRDHPKFTEGRYAFSEKDFNKNITMKGLNSDKVTTIPGFYRDSLTSGIKRKYQIKSASIVMVDCDFYESTKLVLDFITDLLVDGTIIIFDDWFNYRGNPKLGERRACQEWLNSNPNLSLTEFSRWGATQNSFIVHKS